MNKFFSNIKKNFGFGCMRLPMKDGAVDHSELTKMVDAFLESGFNYSVYNKNETLRRVFPKHPAAAGGEACEHVLSGSL